MASCKPTPRPWNVGLLALGLFAITSAWALHPLDGQWVATPGGERFGETCTLISLFGVPCPQCGMTRSWVWAARGDIVQAFWLNPAGLALFVASLTGGAIGAVRLSVPQMAHRRVPRHWLVVGIVAWLVLYIVPWLARLLGVNPLPTG